MGADSFDKVIGALYAAASGEEDWETALLEMSEAVGGATIFVFQGRAAAQPSFDHWACRFDETMWSRIGHNASDQFDPKQNLIVSAMLRKRVGHPFDRRVVMPDDVLDRDDLLRCAILQGLYHARYVVTERTELPLAGAWIGMPRRKGAVEGQTAEAFDVWANHLGRALRLRGLFAELSTTTRGVLRALSLMSVGAICLGHAGQMLELNEAAQEILRASDGLHTRGRLLVIDDREAAQFLAVARARTDLREQRFTIRRPSGLPPYSAAISPIPGAGRADALQTIADPAEERTTDTRVIEALMRYDLTPTEARVAVAVGRTLSKPQIAEKLSISENTVKSHISSIGVKLGAGSMTQIAVIVRSNALRL